MPQTVQVGTILMKERPGMTQFLGLESEHGSGNGVCSRCRRPTRRGMGQDERSFGPGNKPMKPDEKQSLERILESAIVVSWPDLIGEAQTGLIHIEYGFAPTGTLYYLKVWSSLTRGHWLLACEYWMSASTFHGTGAASTMDTNPKVWLTFWSL